MKTKRLIALTAALLLLCSLGSVFAANPGSAQDPLLSRSYLTTWSSQLLQNATAAMERSISAAYRSAVRQMNRTFDIAENNSIRNETLPSGASVALTSGNFFTLTGGAATVQIKSGTLVDATTGHVVSSGSLSANHRYIACENLSAVLTCTAPDTTLLLSASTIVSYFVDVVPTQWYGLQVEYNYLYGLMAGMSTTEFGPSVTLTRAMFVTILGRLAGVDASAYPGTSFSDTPTGQYYSPYVEWGAKTGIVAGMGNGKFEPGSAVTREQMAAFVARYLTKAELDLPQSGSSGSFHDQASISSWAKSDVALMVQTGIFRGDANGYFRPGSNATRAEAATVFMQLREAILRLNP